MNHLASRHWREAFGIALCTVLAIVTALLFASRSSRLSLPLLFVVVLVALAMRFGTLVGVIGSFVSALVFAMLLYPPVHSLHVRDAGARANLAWMVLAGVSLSYLLSGPPAHEPHDPES